MSSLHLVLVLFDAVDKLPGFSPNLQGFFYLDLQVFGLLGLRGLQEGLFFSEAHIKQTPYIILSERMAHFVWRLSSHFYCKTSLYSGEHQLRSRGYPQITGFTVDGDGKMSGEGLP